MLKCTCIIANDITKIVTFLCSCYLEPFFMRLQGRALGRGGGTILRDRREMQLWPMRKSGTPTRGMLAAEQLLSSLPSLASSSPSLRPSFNHPQLFPQRLINRLHVDLQTCSLQSASWCTFSSLLHSTSS